MDPGRNHLPKTYSTVGEDRTWGSEGSSFEPIEKMEEGKSRRRKCWRRNGSQCRENLMVSQKLKGIRR